MNNCIECDNIKPFLRWAGGKTWLTKHLNKILLGKKFNNYYEPFLGGGAIFLALDIPKNAFLSDLNEELINTFQVVKNNPKQLIAALEEYDNSKDCYYKIRKIKYSDGIQKAAKFIFLNQTSYNGLYRVNLQGEYNVPFGYRKKNFIEEEKLIKISRKLQCATITCGDFISIKTKIVEGDLIFLDPPYTVSHNSNGFIKYNEKLFSLDDQKRLSKLVDYIGSIGAFYILTNAAHDTILQLFSKSNNYIELNRYSLIGGKNAKRGQVKEYLFTNIV